MSDVPTFDRPLVLGAVAYDPKVVTIWEGFADWFAAYGLDLDVVLYSNYESQVDAHLAGHLDVAWNSPLAWVQTRRQAAAAGRRAAAVAMRDTDQDLTSVILVRAESHIDSVAGLAGRTVATGAVDSPQATLLPLAHLEDAGLATATDLAVRPFDLLRGKHGDHVGGEREAAAALVAGDVDAACLIDANQLAFAKEGLLEPGATRVLTRTAPYDHCTMTVLDDAPARQVDRFVELLLSMSFDDPVTRPLLEMEGLTEWRPGRTSGFIPLERAVDRLGICDGDGRGLPVPFLR